MIDAKPARSAKARAVAQTAFYSHLLTGVQDIRRRWMHLALGNDEFVPLKAGDHAAYEWQAGDCRGRSSRRTVGRTRRLFRIRSRSSTVRSAGEASSTPGGANVTMTFR